MRSLTHPLTDQSPSGPSPTGSNKSISYLASHYMDMFDPAKLDLSVLGKRKFQQDMHGSLNDELAKKVKTPLTLPDQRVPVAMPNYGNLVFNQNFPLNMQYTGAPMGDSSYMKMDLGRVQQLQSLNALFNIKQQQDILSLQQGLLLQTTNKLGMNCLPGNNLFRDKAALSSVAQQFAGNLNVKEEFVGSNAQQMFRASNALKAVAKLTSDCKSSPHETSSELSSEKCEVQTNMSTDEEPALVEYTSKFPDWDLATIFSFLRSGKPKEIFEKERKFRNERKLRKMRIALKAKEKTVPIRRKAGRTKKVLDSGDEYKPASRLGNKLAKTPERNEIQSTI